MTLNFYLEHVSSWIEELLGRPNMAYGQYTEYYSSTLTGSILLKHRPVYAVPTPLVYISQNGFYGSTPDAFPADTLQVYGENFCLKIDQDDGLRSRCGILLPINNGNGATQNGGWFNYQRGYSNGLLSPYLSPVPGSIKVVYYGGYKVDDLPGTLRMACNMLVARMRTIMPLGVELTSESYEERSVAYLNDAKDKQISQVKAMLWNYRNWSW